MRPSRATRSTLHRWLLAAAFLVTAAVYWPGLYGGFLFDDYPNIVDNHGVQPHDASVGALVGAALSSPASEFKRPLASLSFAVNYLTTGIDPYWMKLTNLVIHLLNGLLVFVLTRALLRCSNTTAVSYGGVPEPSRTGVIAALVAAGWMLLPINLTGVLYIVQRMESMANLFVLLGLIGYIAGRRRMLGLTTAGLANPPAPASKGRLGLGRFSAETRGFLLCVGSITVPTAVGILAKETAVMLPLYALLIEWALFGFRPAVHLPREESDSLTGAGDTTPVALIEPLSIPPGHLPPKSKEKRDRRIVGLFLLVLVLPMAAGLAWLLPGIVKPETWAARDFTLRTRLLSEARIIVDYVRWTLLPTPDALSFYHDDFRISTGLLTPWTTLASVIFLAALVWLMVWSRARRPLVALGIALFLGCQLLTGTILPLELVYEHRNYFASFGLLLAIVPLLAAPAEAASTCKPGEALPMALPRYALLAGLMLSWVSLTAMTAYAWGNPLRLAEDLAARAPQSPRAEYELGRTYIIYSHYDPASPFTRLAYAPLEKAAALPDASILAEQALIFMNARMHLPLKPAWWNSLIAKLKARPSTVQDESSLAALTQCSNEHRCDLPQDRMMEAFMAALSHPDPSARLLATYGDYAWNGLDDHALGLRMTEAAIQASPNEPAYRITLIRMLAAQGRKAEAGKAIKQLATMNIGGRLNGSLAELRKLPGLQ